MPKFAANLSMMYGEWDFLDRFAAAAEDGFGAVEYLFPYDHPAAELRRRLDDNGLVQALHNLPPGDWAAGERGVAIFPERVPEFRESVARGADYAAALGAQSVNCLCGLAPEGADRARLSATLVENLAFAAGRMAAVGVKLVVEPINSRRDMPGFFLNTVAQAAELLDAVGADNLSIQFDIYHEQVMAGDLAPSLKTHLPRIGHVQVADTPGRHEPGTGEINYAFLFDWLDQIGYRGWVGCEYRPRAGTRAGLDWIRPWLGGR
ncbi:2-oxo-tetronate isomerase [Rubrimonas cliftonensis]|uniref:Hydroxypyruvate isomerase n=1 Tax=Rubrimonas cliftonensis TaxID=89524 RepID=A0A1H3X8D1_9RHOB|nr:2-oxo-tetronate isomerase [Rubrimonas cliftonensis]SDZ95647.1 hydroxypyruvate isomerase [Rubrimonas cliftonensis]